MYNELGIKMWDGKQFTKGAGYQLNEKRVSVEVNADRTANAELVKEFMRTNREEFNAIFAAMTAAGNSRDEILATIANRAREAAEVVEEPKATAAKSKVCVIANRLNRQGMNRSEAFRKAWATVKAETVETKVSGVTYGNRQTAIEHLTKYDSNLISVNLERETGNEYDNNAVKVITTVQGKGSYTIGYLPRMTAAIIAPLIDAHKAVRATFKEIRGKYHNYHNYGLCVSVSV